MNPNEVIIVNDRDEELGIIDKMEAHRKGVLHRAVSVFIFNSKKEWLLQRRAEEKYHSGLLWSNTSCTHPMKGEDVKVAGVRRLQEEMGMTANLNKLFNFKYIAYLDNDLIEHELDHVFIGMTDDLPEINLEEVCEYRYISTSDLKKEIKETPEIFSEWFKSLFLKINKETLI